MLGCVLKYIPNWNMKNEMNKYPRVILKSGKEQSLQRFHPWVFSGAIKEIEGSVVEGEGVSVYTNKGEFLASGHYQIGSIAIRILSFDNISIDQNFWNDTIGKALQLRKSLGLYDNQNTNAFRLVHGEGDGLPGLIIDLYNDTAVVQMHSIGMYRDQEFVANALKFLLSKRLKSIYSKSESTMPFKSKVKASDGFIFGGESSGEIIENACRFNIDWVKGQKTGFFLDQRDNRKLLGEYSKNKAVLNMFAYTGGFSVYALNGGASLVHSVDSSTPAIEMANKNVALNFPSSNHTSYTEDAFRFLANAEGMYDIIILDPPAFAKHNDALRNALQGYKKLNALGIEQVKPGGLIFTFSCSQVVSKNDFRLAVFSGAALARRKVRILHQVTQPADHPVNIYHPEGEYLKGLVLFVE